MHRPFLFCLLLVFPIKSVLGTVLAHPNLIFAKGVGLGLYAEDPEHDYEPLVNEIVDLGANSVALYIPYFQENGSSNEIYSKPGRTPQPEVIKEVYAQCSKNGLKVLLVPIVLLDKPQEGEWRGNIAPDNPELWWASYQEKLIDLISLFGIQEIEYFSIGSELSSMEEGYDIEWCETVKKVRRQAGIFTKIIYTANWDQLDKFPAWHRVDMMGISGYYELADWTEEPMGWEPTLEEFEEGWAKWKKYIYDLRTENGLESLPFVFTEIGYPSHRHGARYPWNYTLKQPVDLEQQVLCYQAFMNTWEPEEPSEFRGAFWYNYFEEGGPEDTGYTPRGKPAAQTLQTWFTSLAEDMPRWHYRPPLKRYDECDTLITPDGTLNAIFRFEQQK